MVDQNIYKPSENSPAYAFFIAVGLGVALAILLGFVYNFLLVVIPFVYVNFIISGAFGAILGYGVRFFSRWTKIRSKRQTLILAGITGFVGFYFQWIAYFVFLSSIGHSFQAYQDNFVLFYNPVLFGDLLLQLNRVGSWSMFGVMFTDFPLWIIWGLEAVLIIGVPILLIHRHPIVPFSEKFNRWYPKLVLKNQFESIAGQNQFKEELAKDVEKTIKELSYGASFRFSEVSIYYIHGEEVQYVSVDNVFIADRGKGKENRSSIIHLLEITDKTASNLIEHYGAKKQFILEY